MTTILPSTLVLAAGLGTRLRPLTFCRAKAAVPVAGVPLICRQLEQLVNQGVQDVVVNLHHRPHTITKAVGHGLSLGCNVRFSWEPVVLGSAGGPRHALPLLDQRFILVNGDTLCDVNLVDLLHTHLRQQASVTLSVAKNPAPSRYGGVITDQEGWVREFVPAGDTRQSWHFVGVQVAEASVFSRLVDGKPASSIGGLYNNLLSYGQQIATHRVSGQFFDIGTPADYLATNQALSGSEIKSQLFVGERPSVHPTALITKSVLWDDVVVGANCIITSCVLTDGVRLPAGTVLDRQAVIQLPSDSKRTAVMPKIPTKGTLLTVPIKDNQEIIQTLE